MKIFLLCLAAGRISVSNFSQVRCLPAYPLITNDPFFSDWHETSNGNKVGLKARSSVGGYFVKLFGKTLAD